MEAKKIDIPRQKRETVAADPRERQQPVGQQATLGDPPIVEPCASAHYRPQLKKPKTLKMMTSYDLCKQECKRQRDQQSTKDYVTQLREELRMAEEQERLIEQQSQQEVTLNPSSDTL